MVTQLRLVAECGSVQAAAVTFEDFWLLYPRRVAKREAMRAWERVPQRTRIAVMVALYDWRRVWLVRGDLQYVPHAATWLNGERWEDELPPGYAPARERRAELHDAAPAQPMPSHVRALLEQLRAKLK